MLQALGSYFYEFNRIKALEVVGAVLGITGALIMSFVPGYALVAWIVWLGSSVCLGLFAKQTQLPFLLLLQTVFFFVNLSGIYNSI